jgi:predicted  nucleic acid-binding Zn-ribbon protein
MEPTDITIEILKDIRSELHDGLQSVRDEIQGVREEVQGVREEVRDVRRRQTEGEIRVATELVAIAGVMREVRDELREDRALRARVDDHERRLRAIEKQAQ